MTLVFIMMSPSCLLLNNITHSSLIFCCPQTFIIVIVVGTNIIIDLCYQYINCSIFVTVNIRWESTMTTYNIF